MKSLATFKGLATRLRKQISKTKEMIVECEKSYYSTPCTLTVKALDKAEKKLHNLEGHLDNVMEMINHYDFYQRCREEEEREVMGREYYSKHPIMFY